MLWQLGGEETVFEKFEEVSTPWCPRSPIHPLTSCSHNCFRHRCSQPVACEHLGLWPLLATNVGVQAIALVNCFPSIAIRSFRDSGHRLILGLTTLKTWTLSRLHLPGSLNTRESLVLRSQEASGSQTSRWRSMSEFYSSSFHENIVCLHRVCTCLSQG